MLDRYRPRVSGPLLDRIDLHVEVPRVSVSSLAEDTPAAESSAAIRARVPTARARATTRLARLGIAVNAQIPGREVRRVYRIDARGRRLLEAASDRLGLSARAYRRILRVARSIADLAGEDEITTAHLAGASIAVPGRNPGSATMADARQPSRTRACVTRRVQAGRVPHGRAPERRDGAPSPSRRSC